MHKAAYAEGRPVGNLQRREGVPSGRGDELVQCLPCPVDPLLRGGLHQDGIGCNPEAVGLFGIYLHFGDCSDQSFGNDRRVWHSLMQPVLPGRGKGEHLWLWQQL